MIGNINNNQVQNAFAKTARQQVNSGKAMSQNSVDASLELEYASIIDQAVQMSFFNF